MKIIINPANDASKAAAAAFARTQRAQAIADLKAKVVLLDERKAVAIEQLRALEEADAADKAG